MMGAGRGPAHAIGRRHYCLVHRCRTPVDRLVCRGHWNAIPYELRAAIWRTWASGRGATSRAHQDAVRNALRSVTSEAT
jgi:hypothetical protein